MTMMRCLAGPGMWGRLMLVPVCLGLMSGGCSDKSEEQGNAVAVEAATDAAQHLPKVPLLVRHGDGAADSRLSVELASEPDQQEKGLMHRTDLKPGEGMLFPMLPPRNPSFWMKDTPIPLDLVFIRPDGGVAKIVARAKPNDPTPLFADVPVAGVLELRGGDAAALGIGEGDTVNWGACAGENGSVATKPDNFCPPR